MSRSFLGGAISTASAPSRNIDLNCRSPVTPRTPRRYDGDSTQQTVLYVDNDSSRYSAYSNSAFLPTPRKFPITSIKDDSSRAEYGNEDDRNDRRSTGSSITLVSSSENVQFLPQTPVYPNNKNPSSKLGTFSAINIILGKTVGVGVYSIPSSVYVSVGSVGMALLMWTLGALLSFCGLAVYLDLGTAMPRSGGERVYLERIFKKPYMLSTCMFMAYVVLLGFSAPNCIVLGEYVMYALNIEINRWNVRCIAVGVITLLCFIHQSSPRTGLRIINVLGVGKMLILAIVILSGVAGAALGIGSTPSATSPILNGRRLTTSNELHLTGSTATRNFSNIFAGSSTQPYDYATALLKVLYCFRGYSTANTVLSSIHDPIPTLKIAAPVALSIVSLGYILFATSLFLIVELTDFQSSGITITGHFFRNIFGEVLGERILPCFIIISAFGNIAATSFAQARVNQELGKDGLLPFSHFFSGQSSIRNSIEASPTPGLFLHWLISILVILVPPPGEIYNFLVDIGGYPVSVISVAISAGLLYLQMTPSENYESPFRAKKFYTITFLLSNCLLLILPWIKPKEEKGNSRFPYYAYPATALGILGSGVVYWFWWAKFKPLFTGKSERSWMRHRGHKINGSAESLGLGVPMSRMKSYGSDEESGSGDEERRELLDDDDDDDAVESPAVEQVEMSGDGMRKRAPCVCNGCLLRRDMQLRPVECSRGDVEKQRPESSSTGNGTKEVPQKGLCRCEGCLRRHPEN